MFKTVFCPFSIRCLSPLLLLALAACSLPLSSALTGSVAPRITPDPIAGLIDATPSPVETVAKPQSALASMGFSIQVGAFSQVANAARLETSLDEIGLGAYYFRDPAGLFKVRFGNYTNYAAVRAQAVELWKKGIIGRFFIVIPENYRAAQIQRSGQGDLRDDLVQSARHFIGVPYLWGGETRKGFDCSGLTLVCYRINGLNLPRNSRAQFARGRKVAQKNLQKGDLVFFATHGGRRVTHVGIYIGLGRFIHAPRTGKNVRVANLSSPYWAHAYRGGRSYL